MMNLGDNLIDKIDKNNEDREKLRNMLKDVV